MRYKDIEKLSLDKQVEELKSKIRNRDLVCCFLMFFCYFVFGSDILISILGRWFGLICMIGTIYLAYNIGREGYFG